jgi:3-oxoacyl-(acyl-carrier-protein) synthase III
MRCGSLCYDYEVITTRILAAATHFPSSPISMDEIEKRILDSSESKAKLPVRSIKRLTGVQQVFHRADGENASDLASEAAKKAMHKAGVSPNDIDMLIFASASQDLIEPATSHIIAHNLGTTSPVFDIKNACNSFLNGMQVANLFITSGTYKTVLVVTGETPSVSMRWNCRNREEFTKSFAGFSMSDSGGAVVLQADTTETHKGIISIDMDANSQMWDVGILGTGGSRFPRDEDATYFNMDGHALYNAFKSVGCDMLFQKISERKLNWNDFAAVGMHQVSSIYNEMLLEELDIPTNKAVATIKDYGNLASNSLPLQLETVMNSGRVKPGELFAFVGLGGGISTGLGIFEL